MKLSPEEIVNNPEYNHILTLSFLDIVPFVFTYVKKRSIVTIIAITIFVCAIFCLVVVRIGMGQIYSFGTILPYTISGLVIIPLLLIIPHELLHVLPYLMFGAKGIKIGANFKEFYFYVTANNFPINSAKFVIVATLPIIIITLSLIMLYFVIDNTLWSWSFLLAGVMHLTMCIGDIALINFVYTNRKRRIITWDNIEKKEAYFYSSE